MSRQSSARVAEAVAYAGLIAEICKLSASRDYGREAELTDEVFQRLGYETTRNKRGYCMRSPGESHWQTQPRILHDFGTAVRYTIGHRHGTLDRPLEMNWYVQQMCEDTETTTLTGGRIATWAVRLAKVNRTAVDATAITPAAALVAAWLRTHTL